MKQSKGTERSLTDLKKCRITSDPDSLRLFAGGERERTCKGEHILLRSAGVISFSNTEQAMSYHGDLPQTPTLQLLLEYVEMIAGY